MRSVIPGAILLATIVAGSGAHSADPTKPATASPEGDTVSAAPQRAATPYLGTFAPDDAPSQPATGERPAREPAPQPSTPAEQSAPAPQQPQDGEAQQADGAAGFDVKNNFRNICSFCHADYGRKAGRGPQLMDSPRSDEFLFDRIKHGVTGRMPGFGGTFSDAQINQIVRFIRSLKPGEVPQNPT